MDLHAPHSTGHTPGRPARTRRAGAIGVVAAVAVVVAVRLFVADPSSGDAAGDAEPLVDGTFVLPDGSYEMVGYGTVLVADGDAITTYYVTDSTCTPGEPFDNELDVDHAVDRRESGGADGGSAAGSSAGQVIVDLVGPTTDYRLRRLTEAPVCDGDTDSITALDEVFSTHYPFFEERGIDWPTSLDRIRDDVQAGASLAESLAVFMVELGDGHTLLPDLDVEIDVDAFDVDGIDTVPELADLLDTELDATFARIDDLRVDRSGNVAWGRFTDHPETGYLYIGGFVSGGDAREDRDALVAALDDAIVELGTAEHLLVDARFNPGGNEDLAVVAAGYFVDESTDAYQKWSYAETEPNVQTVAIAPQSASFGGRVTILSSPITASAAEVFLLAMRTVADATIVGTPSYGEFSDAIDWRLPDGTEFTMSMEVYTDLDGNRYEAVGIPVDVRAPFDEAVDVAMP